MKKNHLLKKMLVFATVLAMISLTACGGGGGGGAAGGGGGGGGGGGTTAGGDGPKILKVGSIGPHTGPSARVGEEFRNAIEIAFDRIDYRIGDYEIEIIYVDSESDAEKAARAYERAITQDNIDVGFLNWHSWVSVACMELAARYEIPHFFGFGAGSDINDKFNSDPDRYKYWMGKGWPLPEKLTVGYVETVIEAIETGIWDPPTRNFAVYGVDQDWGRQFGAGLKAQFEAAGWTCVAEEWVQLGETEFYPLLNKMRSLDVSLMVGTMSDPPSVSSFIKQSREVNLEALIVCDGLGWVGEWYELTGDASNYVIDQIPQWTTPEAKAFAEEFAERFGTDPGPSTAGMTFDLANFFIKVLQATYDEYGELNSEVIMKFAEENVMTGNLSYTGGIIHEEYKFTPETFPDLVVGEGYYIFPVIQYFDGDAVMVWPSAWAESELRVR